MLKKESPYIKGAELLAGLLPESAMEPADFLLHRQGEVLLLRDDQHGTIPAGKQRKYASLLPWLRQHSIDTVVFQASLVGNHLPAACELLIRHGIRPVPLLRKASRIRPNLNTWLAELLLPPSQWRFEDVSDWQDLARRGREIVAEMGPGTVFLEEGAFHPAAVAGAMDLARQIQAAELSLRDVVIDAGTGLSALALAAALAMDASPIRVQLIAIAGKEAEFRERYAQLRAAHPALPDWTSLNLEVHHPPVGASFGAAPAQVKTAIRRYAQTAGILTDPIYSAKTLMAAESLMEKGKMDYPALVVHSGGFSSLLSFRAGLSGSEAGPPQ